MKTDVVSAEAMERAVEVLRRGGLVAFPTETVYGLAGDAENPAAVERIFSAKGRPADHPLILHVGHAEPMGRYVEVTVEAERLAEAFWPGPLTIILRRRSDRVAAAAGGLPTVGLRCPGHPLALAMLGRFGRAVAAPSANRFGRVSPTTAADVLEELNGRIDLVLDGGACPVGIESTIVDLSGNRPAVLRPGAVTAEMISQVLGGPLAGDDSDRPACSGRLESHYAPAARLILCSGEDLIDRAAEWVRSGPAPVGVLVDAAADLSPLEAAVGQRRFREGVRRIDFPAPSEAAAVRLYAALRQLDREGCRVGIVAEPPALGIGLAVRDRLIKAAAQRPANKPERPAE